MRSIIIEQYKFYGDRHPESMEVTIDKDVLPSREEPILVTWWIYEGSEASPGFGVVSEKIGFFNTGYLLTSITLIKAYCCATGIGFDSPYSVDDKGNLLEKIRVKTLKGEETISINHGDCLYRYLGSESKQPLTFSLPCDYDGKEQRQIKIGHVFSEGYKDYNLCMNYLQEIIEVD